MQMQNDSGSALVARGIAGGALMGLANLVPGVSGGTMLLAAGVYPQCIDAMAKVTTLRADRWSAGLLAGVAFSGCLTILLLAGFVKTLVVEHRWAMYSLFLGSTLGGVPALWSLIRRTNGRAAAGFALGLSAMVATAFGPEAPAQPGTAAAPALFLAGMGSFAAMILPGLSGGYILVLSGQYVPILTAVDGVKSAVLQVGRSPWHLLVESAWILAPFALGGMLALVGMSWLVDWLLGKQRSLMLGFLLGLLIGAVLGLWPFEAAGTGPAMPDLVHATAALGLVACGFALTAAVARLGSLDRGP